MEMKKLLPTLSFVMIGALFLFSAKQERTALYQCVDKNDATQTRSSGGIGGYTGSPGDGFDCTDCHDSPIDFSLVASITTNIPASGYVPGQSYTIQVGGTSDGSEFGRGFELTAENASNVAVGSYDLTGATGNPQEIPSDDSVGHSNEVSFTWSFNWIAPATDQGTITFYASVLAVNGAQGTNGDQNSTASVSYDLSTLSIDDADLLTFRLYPNPVVDQLHVVLPDAISTATADVFNVNGQRVLSSTISRNEAVLNVATLAKGMYFIRLNNANNFSTGTFVKR